MSNGWKDAYSLFTFPYNYTKGITVTNSHLLKVLKAWEVSTFAADRDAIDGLDEFDFSDLLDEPTVSGDKKQTFSEWYTEPKEPKCDCGSEKTYGKDSNLHTDWCSKAKR